MSICLVSISELYAVGGLVAADSELSYATIFRASSATYRLARPWTQQQWGGGCRCNRKHSVRGFVGPGSIANVCVPVSRGICRSREFEAFRGKSAANEAWSPRRGVKHAPQVQANSRTCTGKDDTPYARTSAVTFTHFWVFFTPP